MKEKAPNISPLFGPLMAQEEFLRLEELHQKGGISSLFGLTQAHKAQLAAALYLRGRSVLLVGSTEAEANQLYRQVQTMLELNAAPGRCALLPLRDIPFSGVYAASQSISAQRVAALSLLVQEEPALIVTAPGALLQRLAPPQRVQAAVFTLRPGDVLPPRELLTRLVDGGYERVELVEGPGQVALRGDRLDVFPVGAGYPCRIEYFDDEIDQLRLYDPENQRSLEQAMSLCITPATEAPQDEAAIRRGLAAIGEGESFSMLRVAWEANHPALGAEALIPALYAKEAQLLDYLPQGAMVLLSDPARLEQEWKLAYDLFWDEFRVADEQGLCLPLQKDLMLAPQKVMKKLRRQGAVQLFSYARALAGVGAGETVYLPAQAAPVYPAGTQELAADVERLRKTGETVLLFAGDRAKQLYEQLLDSGCSAALVEKLERLPAPGETWVVGQRLLRGFCWTDLRLTVLGEGELFGKSQTQPAKRRKKGPQLLLSQIQPGDYVVHEAHGVGRFVGVKSLTVHNATRDYLLLQYAGTDQLYIPVDQLDRVQKYVGAGEAAPRLNRLGGGDWNRQVSRAKSAVKKLAVDLADLYARRSLQKGFAFSADNEWQKKMEDAFPYQETPDQLRCLEEIKEDMESARPMDRLLCGDVGYGKTEVALRAAFKAVQDSKQVAILAPHHHLGPAAL